MSRYNTYARPFLITYPGCWDGHAKTREGAINAASRHCVSDGYLKATITDKRTNQDVARVHVSRDRTTVTVEAVRPLKTYAALRRVA
jgi:hypothetical protein